MPNRYKTVINPGPCFQLGDFNRRVCLPIKKDCTPTAIDWLLNECGNNYCDTFNPRTDVPFNMVYVAGDKIQFQFRFDDNFNGDPENPTQGWGDFITGTYYNHDGTIISEDYSDFASNSIVGYDGNASYQVIEIDTAMLAELGVKCFTFQAKSHTGSLPDVTQTICTEMYGEVACEDTITIQGIYSKYDCLNNWYGDPVAYVGDLFRYNNTMRFAGQLWADPSVIKREIVSQKLKSSTYDQVFKFWIHAIVPLYVMNTCAQFFNASKILIDGAEYQCDGYEPEKAGTGFIISQPVYLRCESINNNCNV